MLKKSVQQHQNDFKEASEASNLNGIEPTEDNKHQEGDQMWKKMKVKRSEQS